MRAALSIEQDVARLEVPVQDAALMGVMNGASNRGDEFRRILQLVASDVRRLILNFGFRNQSLLTSAATSNGLREICSFDQLHAEEVMTLVFTNFENGNDVRMIEFGGSLGLDVEAAHVIGGSQLPARITLTATSR